MKKSPKMRRSEPNEVKKANPVVGVAAFSILSFTPTPIHDQLPKHAESHLTQTSPLINSHYWTRGLSDNR